MSADLLTTSNITFVIGILAVIFSVYNYFRKPQEEVDQKAALLAQQVKWERETNEKKFGDLGNKIADAFTLAQNHTHSVDLKCDKLIDATNILSIQVGKLETIINERIPSYTKN